jgi:hypothetical protein
MRIVRKYRMMLVLTLLIATGAASPLSADNTCSAQTLNGAYTYTLRGGYIGDQYGDVFDFAAAGRFVADGNGGFSGAETTSQGESISKASPYTGTYTVNDDCTGTMIFRNSQGNVIANMDMAITNNAKEIELIETDNGTTISGRAQQQFPAQ